MNERPTPETDALEASLVTVNRTQRYYGALNFARKLERERDEALRMLVRLRQDLADPPADVQEAVLDKLNLRSVITERDEALELARELRDALEKQHKFSGGFSDTSPKSAFSKIQRDTARLIAKAKEVLPDA